MTESHNSDRSESMRQRALEAKVYSNLLEPSSYQSDFERVIKRTLGRTQVVRSERLVGPEKVEEIQSTVAIIRDLIFQQGTKLSERPDLLEEALEEGLIDRTDAEKRYLKEYPGSRGSLYADVDELTSVTPKNKLWFCGSYPDYEFFCNFDFQDNIYLTVNYTDPKKERHNVIGVYSIDTIPLENITDEEAVFVTTHLEFVKQRLNEGKHS